MSDPIPMVDYLVLGNDPHLVANECSSCGARFFDRRNACAACGAVDSFSSVDIPTTGEVRAFTIVKSWTGGDDYVPAVVDCDGTSVRGQIVNTPPDPEHVKLGMKVRLTTYSIGADSTGTEAITYGFEPV